MEDTIFIETEEDVAPNVKEIGKRVMAALNPVNSHTTVGHMECLPTQVLTSETCRVPQEERGLAQQNIGEQTKLHFTDWVGTC